MELISLTLASLAELLGWSSPNSAGMSSSENSEYFFSVNASEEKASLSWTLSKTCVPFESTSFTSTSLLAAPDGAREAPTLVSHLESPSATVLLATPPTTEGLSLEQITRVLSFGR